MKSSLLTWKQNRQQAANSPVLIFSKSWNFKKDQSPAVTHMDEFRFSFR